MRLRFNKIQIFHDGQRFWQSGRFFEIIKKFLDTVPSSLSTIIISNLEILAHPETYAEPLLSGLTIKRFIP